MPNEIRVATLNIWNRMGDWPARLAAIRAHVEREQPDLLALQEVVRVKDGDGLDQSLAIAEGLGYHAAWGRTPLDEGHPMGNAVLSRWPITRREVFALPRVGTDELRSILFVETTSPFGTLPVFTTHLNWKLHHGHVRERQIRELTDRVAQLAPVTGFPPLLLGDFNAVPESDEIRFLSGHTSLGGESVYFADAFALAGDGSNGTTFSRKNPHAAPLREPERRIDYIFVRGPDERGRGEPLEARVCFDTPVNGAFASDHFGVIARISA